MDEDWRYQQWGDPTDEDRRMWADVDHDRRLKMLGVARRVLREAQEGTEPPPARVLQLAMLMNVEGVRRAGENFKAVLAEHASVALYERFVVEEIRAALAELGDPNAEPDDDMLAEVGARVDERLAAEGVPMGRYVHARRRRDQQDEE